MLYEQGYYMLALDYEILAGGHVGMVSHGGELSRNYACIALRPDQVEASQSSLVQLSPLDFIPLPTTLYKKTRSPHPPYP